MLENIAQIQHTPEYINCFETRKNILINDPTLQNPDFSIPFYITSGTSYSAIGAVLSRSYR